MSEHRPSLFTRSFQDFFRTEAAAGVLLFACACAALAVANSPWADAYHRVWNSAIDIAYQGHTLSMTLHEWINDGLMAIFFLLVGLEIKREIIAGELSSPRHAILPIAGALGGMAVPAAIYLLVTAGTAAAAGWAIPMATDIAFAIGALTLVAPRAPTGLKIFLTALAIVDDLGAVIVIAAFYTRGVAGVPLAIAAGILAMLLLLNRLRVRRLAPFLILGVALWYYVHASGVHATIAGVLLAFTIPTRTRINAAQFSETARGLLDDFDRTETGDLLVLTSRGQQEAIVGLERASEYVTAPLLRLEHVLHSVSAFIVMPLFAFANAGVELGVVGGTRTVWAVMLGLVIGKPLGITGAALLAARSPLATLPERVLLARRYRVHDVAVHRYAGVRRFRTAGRGQSGDSRWIGGIRGDRNVHFAPLGPTMTRAWRLSRASASLAWRVVETLWRRERGPAKST
jgi:Na+:H+ antiporter, NhaA family